MRSRHPIAFKALALTGVLVAGTASADPCDTYLTTEMNWVRDRPTNYVRYLSATINSLDGNGKARYIDSAALDTYSPASCLYLNGICYPVAASLRNGTSESMYFNSNCAQQNGVCANPFSNGSYTVKVWLTSTYVSIDPDLAGAASIVINNLTCQNGVMYGFSSESPAAMFIVRLVRNEYAIPR